MADEISVTAALEIKNGDFTLPKLGATNLKFNQAAKGGGVPGTKTITTGGVDIDLSSLTAFGWLWMMNLDATNFVEWGPKSGGVFYPLGRLEPGEPAVFRLKPGITLTLKADTASCKVHIAANEK